MPKYQLEYEEDSSTLFVRIGKKRYVICQASGEMIPAEGHGIDDYYWSSAPNSAEEVRSIFRDIVATNARLRDEHQTD